MSTLEASPGIPISDRAAYIARIYIAVTVPMLVVAIAIFSTRFYLRVWSLRRADATEVFVSIGFVLNMACWCLILDEMVTTPRVLSFSDASRAIQLSFYSIPISSWVMTCVRASAALTILRFRSYSLAWKMFLYTLTVVQICFSIAFTAFWLTVCRPLSDWWDLTNDGHNCADTQTIRGVAITGASLNIANNVLLSIAPVTFLWNLSRPAGERILVCALMGMGSFTSIASIIKLVALLRWSRQPEGDDLWAMAENLNLWSVTEQFFAVMAACLPFLKPVLHRGLRSAGVQVTVTDSKLLTWYRGGPALFGGDGAMVIPEAQASSHVRTEDESSKVGGQGV